MSDERKTKAQLTAELKAVRQRVSQLEAAEAERARVPEKAPGIFEDAALRASETRYRRLFETAQNGILLLDAATGQIIDVNPFLVKMLGYSHTEFLGKHLWEIGPFRDVAESKLAFEQLQSEEYIRYEDLPLETRAGQRIAVEFVSNVYLVNGVKIIQCNVRDITARKRGQDALRRSEAELKEAQRVGRLGSWAWDATTDTITWSEEYYRIYGFDPNQRLPGYEEHLKVYSPESAARLDAAVKKSIETGVPYEIDLEQIRPDGTRRWVTARGEVKRDANGQIVGLRGTAQDITGRKRAEEQLRESEFFFKESQRAASIGSYKTDFINGFWESSTALDQIFGIDKSYSRSVQGWLDIIHPDDHEMMDRYLREEVISKRKPFNKEYRIIRKSDGEIRWVIGLGEVDFDAEGNIISMIGTIQDITERKRAEEALVASEKEFRLLAEAMPQIVWVTRADGWNIYFNQQWVDYTGLTLEESYGHGWNKPFHPDDQQRAWDAWQNAVTNNGIYSIECRLRRKDMTCRWWLIRGVPVFDERGKITKWFGTCTDIDEIKRAEEEIRKLNAELEERVIQRTACQLPAQVIRQLSAR